MVSLVGKQCYQPFYIKLGTMLKFFVVLCMACFIELAHPYYYGYGTQQNNYAYPSYPGYNQGGNKRSRPDIKIYYESKCPSCRVFDSKYLLKVVRLLGPYVDIHMNPYGHAQTLVAPNGTLSFTCQHGPAECYGNKLHACALNTFDRDTALTFNGCLMDEARPDGGSNDASANECGMLLGINPEPIKFCAKDARGSQLLQYYGVQTDQLNPKYVPHVRLNDVHWDGKPEGFFRDVCAAFSNPPAVCRSQY